MGCEVKAGESIALGGLEGLDRSSRRRERYSTRGAEEEEEAAADAIVIDVRLMLRCTRSEDEMRLDEVR